MTSRRSTTIFPWAAGVWLNGGHLWYITWTQGTDTTFQFYDADGELLTLNAGRSYLAIVSSVTGQELTVTTPPEKI